MKRKNPQSIDRTPGALGPEACAPSVVVDAKQIIRKARDRANLSDAFDFSILFTINLMASTWESAHIPFLSRDASIAILLLVNVLYVVDWFAGRFLPPLKARFIASTWSREERGRLGL
ncbi:MAG: hypothetical protein R3338_09270 [Thermoanaerobaculia bacterium]|nr:hypothetical protein [Thermoanaerobaculia bacterium]